MLGSGEVLLILLILAFWLVPYFQRRAKAKTRLPARKPPQAVKSPDPPAARPVDYEDV